MNFCQNCGTRIEDDTIYCIECGTKLEDINTVQNSSQISDFGSGDLNNNQGTIGFVLALISLFLPIPIIDTIIGLVALAFSIDGLKSKARGLSITGLVISIIAILGSIVLYLEDGYDFF